MRKFRLVGWAVLLMALWVSACVPAANTPAVTPAPVSINNICTLKGQRSQIQGILRLPDSLSCSKNESPNWCTVQLYDPYDDKTLPVSLYVSAGGLVPDQMAALSKNYVYGDFKVQTSAGGLVGHGSLVSLSGKISSAGQPTAGGNEVACTLSDVHQVTALKQLTPLGMAVKRYDLVDAITSGVVLAAINGKGLQRLDLKLKPQVDFNLEINIASGTIFEALAGEVQNMVVRKSALVVLKPNGEVSLEVDVACANMGKKEPTGGDTFKVSKAPTPADLQKLISLAEFPFASNRVQQFAVWTITNNPHIDSYVGIDTTSGLRGGPTVTEIAEMRQLFVAAAIMPNAFNIFK